MENEQSELDELTREIRKLIDDNRKFLEKVMDEEFEAEDSDAEEPCEIEL